MEDVIVPDCLDEEPEYMIVEVTPEYILCRDEMSDDENSENINPIQEDTGSIWSSTCVSTSILQSVLHNTNEWNWKQTKLPIKKRVQRKPRQAKKPVMSAETFNSIIEALNTAHSGIRTQFEISEQDLEKLWSSYVRGKKKAQNSGE